MKSLRSLASRTMLSSRDDTMTDLTVLDTLAEELCLPYAADYYHYFNMSSQEELGTPTLAHLKKISKMGNDIALTAVRYGDFRLVECILDRDGIKKHMYLINYRGRSHNIVDVIRLFEDRGYVVSQRDLDKAVSVDNLEAVLYLLTKLGPEHVTEDMISDALDDQVSVALFEALLDKASDRDVRLVLKDWTSTGPFAEYFRVLEDHGYPIPDDFTPSTSETDFFIYLMDERGYKVDAYDITNSLINNRRLFEAIIVRLTDEDLLDIDAESVLNVAALTKDVDTFLGLYKLLNGQDVEFSGDGLSAFAVKDLATMKVVASLGHKIDDTTLVSSIRSVYNDKDHYDVLEWLISNYSFPDYELLISKYKDGSISIDELYKIVAT